MDTLGMRLAEGALLSQRFTAHLVISVVLLFFFLLLGRTPQKKIHDSVPVKLPTHALLNIWPFYRRRFDFLNWGFRATGQAIYQFSLFRHQVVVLSGEEARKAFFSAKGLDLHEGFKVLLGAIPIVPGVTSDLHTKRICLIHKRLAALQRTEALTQLIPAILGDCRQVMDTWGSSGTFDPFDKVYDVVFQTTIRCLSSFDIANDTVLVARLKKLYARLDSGTTPTSVLLPWFPSPAMVKKLWATKAIYDIIVREITTREKSGVSQHDTLQMLLDGGDNKLAIVGFIMGLLIAGARSTGTTASWLITFLGGHPEWQAKAAAEVDTLLTVYSLPQNRPQSLTSRLATVPLEAWESATPILDALIRETLRVAQPHTAMRKNTGPEIHIGDKIVPTGAFVVYPFSDVHLNPSLYPDPRRFDPSRKEEDTVAYGFVGWGGGKTVCQGNRLAKLKLKLVASMFLLGFQYRIVDKSGTLVDPLPDPDWNDILTCRPSDGSCYLKYKRTEDLL